MSKAEKKRTFESEMLGLPPLKMVLTETGEDKREQTKKKGKEKPGENFNQATVLRIIDKLVEKE